jgi:hypothetical protein
LGIVRLTVSCVEQGHQVSSPPRPLEVACHRLSALSMGTVVEKRLHGIKDIGMPG